MRAHGSVVQSEEYVAEHRQPGRFVKFVHLVYLEVWMHKTQMQSKFLLGYDIA